MQEMQQEDEVRCTRETSETMPEQDKEEERQEGIREESSATIATIKSSATIATTKNSATNATIATTATVTIPKMDQHEGMERTEQQQQAGNTIRGVTGTVPSKENEVPPRDEKVVRAKKTTPKKFLHTITDRRR